LDSVSFFEKILAHLKYWKNFIQFILSIIFSFKNSYFVVLCMMQNKYPISGELDDFKKINLKSYNHIHFIINSKKISEIKYNFDKDLVSVPMFQINSPTLKNVKFFGGISNGDIINGICGGDYDDIPVYEKMVIDIGSNIGDSSIFFSLRGAKQVIGFEPFPKNYNLSIQNVNENNLSQKILINLAGCSSKNTTITIDPDFNSTAGTQLTHFSKGVKVPIFTLDEIIKKFQVPKNSILKIDCEGCEYDIVYESSTETLKHFSYIKIEYHNGYKNLEKKLRNSGFEVNISSPIAMNVFNTIFKKSMNQSQNLNKIGYVGFITAKKI
jgi:FkbM family methyltransferase